MEAFLTTLPPYVHDFLNKYPPTDVFNLLRELICFAVLYSEDRDRLNQSTEEFLKKREQQTTELETVTEKEEEEEKVENVNDDAQVPVLESLNSLEEQQPEKPKLPNTFPEWWGHHEFQPPKKAEPIPIQTPVEPTPKEQKQVKKEDTSESLASTWVSWDAPTQTNMRRAEKARSQIIPDLRSYLEEDHTRMAAVRTSSPTAANNNKRHSMLNLKTNKLLTKTKENNNVTQSPVSLVTPPLKNVKQTTPVKSTSPSRSASVNMTQPRQNAAMRARAEHARLQQEELEKKKTTPPPGSSISLKIKQRANSGIDWEAIKKERRKTIAEQPTTTKK